jgi:hypothetical protein
MRIVADVPEYLVERVRQLISDGRYRSLSSFVVASIESQLTLEESVNGFENNASLLAKLEPVVTEAHLREVAGPRPPRGELPTLKSPPRPGVSAVEQWPWGYINRLLPVKFAIRLLANRINSQETSVPLDAFAAEGAEAAREFGMWLARYDDKQGNPRGERLSEGFPIGDARVASLRRYQNNFVGYERKSDGAMFGALFELKLAGVERVQGKLRLGLTQEGLRFAQIANPIIDNTDLSRALSKEEREFYLAHIDERVPGECFAFGQCLKLIERGVNTREELTEEIKSGISLDWGDSVLGIRVAGATARMTDLGLVSRDKDGQKVVYEVSERGSEWLRNHREKSTAK